MENGTELTHHEIIIALFEAKDGANDAPKQVSSQASDAMPDLKGQTAVISMDENGKISSSTSKGKTGKGAALGGIAGLLIGLPIAGVLVGGIIGHSRRGKKHNAEPDVDKITLEQIAVPGSLVSFFFLVSLFFVYSMASAISSRDSIMIGPPF